jgi:hypothetical protein
MSRWTTLAALLGLAAMLVDTSVHLLAARMALVAAPGNGGRIAVICTTLGIPAPAVADLPGKAGGAGQPDCCAICLHAAGTDCAPAYNHEPLPPYIAANVYSIPSPARSIGNNVNQTLNNRGPPLAALNTAAS